MQESVTHSANLGAQQSLQETQMGTHWSSPKCSNWKMPFPLEHLNRLYSCQSTIYLEVLDLASSYQDLAREYSLYIWHISYFKKKTYDISVKYLRLTGFIVSITRGRTTWNHNHVIIYQTGFMVLDIWYLLPFVPFTSFLHFSFSPSILQRRKKENSEG
jgi:hypothetical protein